VRAGPVTPSPLFNSELVSKDLDAVDAESEAFHAAYIDFVSAIFPAYVQDFFGWMSNRLPPEGQKAHFALSRDERAYRTDIKCLYMCLSGWRLERVCVLCATVSVMPVRWSCSSAPGSLGAGGCRTKVDVRG